MGPFHGDSITGCQEEQLVEESNRFRVLSTKHQFLTPCWLWWFCDRVFGIIPGTRIYIYNIIIIYMYNKKKEYIFKFG